MWLPIVRIRRGTSFAAFSGCLACVPQLCGFPRALERFFRAFFRAPLLFRDLLPLYSAWFDVGPSYVTIPPCVVSQVVSAWFCKHFAHCHHVSCLRFGGYLCLFQCLCSERLNTPLGFKIFDELMSRPCLRLGGR